MRVLINAANLHQGGGVAVAASVISEAAQLTAAGDVTVLASNAVHRNLEELGAATDRFGSYAVHDMRGLSALWKRAPVDRQDFDAVVNVFGPVYDVPLARGSVMGFAQGWIAFPDNALVQRMAYWSRLRVQAKYFVQSLFFLLPAQLVVEQDSIAAALGSRRILRRKETRVVSNTVDEVFWRPELWEPVSLPGEPTRIRLGVVARNYPHKNLETLGDVRRLLREQHLVESDVFVTLTPEEWAAAPSQFRQEVINIGPLTLPQSASFTSQLDAVVFPTLLECFSATPIEARAVGTPLFSTDLPTIRDTVGDYPTYMDSSDPESMAATVALAVPQLLAARGSPRKALVRQSHGSGMERMQRLLSLTGFQTSTSEAPVAEAAG